MKKLVLLSFLASTISFSFTANVFAADDIHYIGEIFTTAGSYCPKGSVEAMGQTLKAAQNQALFSVIGNVYGGDSVDFKLPDLRGRAMVGSGKNPNLPNAIAAGQESGQQQITLASNQVPAPDLNIEVKIPVSTGVGSKNAPDTNTNYLSGSSNSNAGANMWTTQSGQTNPVNVGGVTALATTQVATILPISTQSPVIGIRACIVTVGMFPERNN